jgi:hypothetical protein
MKKPVSIVLLTIFACICLFLLSCTLVKPAADTAAPESALPEATGALAATASSPAEEPSASMAVTGFEFEDAIFTSGNITVKYPRIVSLNDEVRREALNKLIADTALRDIEAIKNEDIAEYEIVYKVTYNTQEVISIRFDGYSYYEGAAHPSQFLYTVTLNVEKAETVTLPDLVQISEEFYKALTEGTYTSEGFDMSAEYEAAIKDMFLSGDPAYWLDELKNADKPGHAVASYLTEDALAVSVPVPHVMGDHVEILLPFAELAGYKTDNHLWEVVDK